MKQELEDKIFSCILIRPQVLEEINFNPVYFNNDKLLNLLKKLHKSYKNLDISLITSFSKDKTKALNYLVEVMQLEVTSAGVNGYYKRLKEIYVEDKVMEYANKLHNKEIDFYEFNKKITELNNLDFDDQELLNTSDIQISVKPEREYTNIKELDYLLKGIEYGKVTLWSGITNAGKTSLMIQFAKECLKQHKKIFYFSGEQTASEFKNYLYIGLCSKEQLDFIPDPHNEKIYDTKPKQEVIDYFDNIYSKELYIYNNDIPNNTIDNMISVMNKAFNRGVRIFFIDNFMQLDNSEKLEEQTRIVEKFKRFARDKNVIINLVAHPRKTQFMKCRLTIFDIAGTQNIANKSANICSIIRTDMLSETERDEVGYVLYKSGYNIDRCDGIVEVIKTKGNNCKMVGLIYDKEFKTYKESPRLSQSELSSLEYKYAKKSGTRKSI